MKSIVTSNEIYPWESRTLQAELRSELAAVLLLLVDLVAVAGDRKPPGPTGFGPLSRRPPWRHQRSGLWSGSVWRKPRLGLSWLCSQGIPLAKYFKASKYVSKLGGRGVGVVE